MQLLGRKKGKPAGEIFKSNPLTGLHLTFLQLSYIPSTNCGWFGAHYVQKLRFVFASN